MPYKDQIVKKEYMKNYMREYLKQKSVELRTKIYNLLGDKCFYCANNDIRVLQIHHKILNHNEDRNKNTNSYMYHKYILTQIELGSKDYQLLCANCHCIEHFPI